MALVVVVVLVLGVGTGSSPRSRVVMHTLVEGELDGGEALDLNRIAELLVHRAIDLGEHQRVVLLGQLRCSLLVPAWM